MYGSLFALGAPSLIVIFGRFGVNRCFLTRMSSCEKAHSSAESSVVDGGGVEGDGETCVRAAGGLAVAGGGVVGDAVTFIAVGDAALALGGDPT